MRPMEPNEAKLYEIFEEIGITDYHIIEHKAVFTSREAEEELPELPGLALKNLLVREKKSGRYFLIILDDHRRLDMKRFKALTGWGQVRFASAEELMDCLGLIPGSVSPFGLVSAEPGAVTVVLGKEITEAADTEPVNFHPNRNTATLTLSKADFIRFLEYVNCPVIWETGECK